MFIERTIMQVICDPGRGHVACWHFIFYKHAIPPGLVIEMKLMEKIKRIGYNVQSLILNSN